MTFARLMYMAEHRRKLRLRDDAVQAQGGRCIYCGNPFGEGPARATLEHIQPKCRGGIVTADNVAASCMACNNERGSANHRAFMRFKAAERLRAALQDMVTG